MGNINIKQPFIRQRDPTLSANLSAITSTEDLEDVKPRRCLCPVLKRYVIYYIIQVVSNNSLSPITKHYIFGHMYIPLIGKKCSLFNIKQHFIR